MGYTHYFEIPAFTDDSWKTFTSGVRKLIKNLPERTNSANGRYDEVLTVHGGLGEGKPTVSTKVVRFNGDASCGLDHDTFLIYKKGTKEFCKTARKPYDLLVVACLVLARSIHGLQANISSDGDDDDVKEGIDFANKVLGLNIPHNLIFKD